MTQGRAGLYIAVFYFVVGWALGIKYEVNLNDPLYWMILFVPGVFTFNLVAFKLNWTMYFGYGACSPDKSDSLKLFGLMLSIFILTLFMWFWFSGRLYDWLLG